MVGIPGRSGLTVLGAWLYAQSNLQHNGAGWCHLPLEVVDDEVVKLQCQWRQREAVHRCSCHCDHD